MWSLFLGKEEASARSQALPGWRASGLWCVDVTPPGACFKPPHRCSADLMSHSDSCRLLPEPLSPGQLLSLRTWSSCHCLTPSHHFPPYFYPAKLQFRGCVGKFWSGNSSLLSETLAHPSQPTLGMTVPPSGVMALPTLFWRAMWWRSVVCWSVASDHPRLSPSSAVCKLSEHIHL